MAQVGEIKVTLEAFTNVGWRMRLVNRVAPIIAVLPDAILERVINWAARGVKVRAFVR